MTEPEPQQTGASPTSREPNISGTDRIFVRLFFWQTILSLVGVFIAVLALYAALTESAAVRQQTSAAVWPFVQISTADFDSGDRAGFTLSATNVGVGPALVNSMRVVIDGQPMRDWAHVVAHLEGAFDNQLERNSISNRVLSPSQKVDLISTMDPALARAFHAVVANPENSVTLCYCSIFNDCWLVDSRRQALVPEAVNDCPNFGAAEFQY